MMRILEITFLLAAFWTIGGLAVYGGYHLILRIFGG